MPESTCWHEMYTHVRIVQEFCVKCDDVPHLQLSKEKGKERSEKDSHLLCKEISQSLKTSKYQSSLDRHISSILRVYYLSNLTERGQNK